MTHLKFDDKLSKTLSQFSGKKILVAFSGGKDSSALLDFIAMHLSEFNLSVVAVYINHHLRDDVMNDLKFCKNFCIARGIEFLIRDITADKLEIKKNGVEAFARKNRYILLRDTLDKTDADFIFTAHTLDDQLETFFINLFTSTSIFSLSGIAVIDDKIYRPMLNISTDEVNDYLTRRNIIPIFDSTNNDNRFIRNLIRSELMPVINHISHGDRCMENILKLQAESKNLSNHLLGKLSSVILIKDDNYLLLDRLTFDRIDNIEKEFILGYLFSEYFRVTVMHIDNAIKLSNSKTSKRIDMPDGYFFESSYNFLRLFLSGKVDQKVIDKSCNVELVIYDDKTIRFTGELKDKALIISRRSLGDKFNGKKVKDILIDKKLTLYERDRLIIVKDSDKIIFIESIILNNCIEVLTN